MLTLPKAAKCCCDADRTRRPPESCNCHRERARPQNGRNLRCSFILATRALSCSNLERSVANCSRRVSRICCKHGRGKRGRRGCGCFRQPTVCQQQRVEGCSQVFFSASATELTAVWIGMRQSSGKEVIPPFRDVSLESSVGTKLRYTLYRLSTSTAPDLTIPSNASS
ncbi:unnamed protein product, partial [Hapterophycus canaliculatus]